ncbi:MAG: SGNH/GDSL hydrolase family protein [Chthoniobacteraceae bacterium]
MSSRLRTSLLLSALIPFLSASLRAQVPARDAVECTPREGLPHFFAKLQRGENVKIAYLGGSITAQAGWRVQSLAHFQKLYPNAKLEEIYAAIGGTGSNMGVFRMDHDVLPQKPDLVFVEFAVNDAGARTVEITQCMEGIVRKIYKAYPDCDICFVYTMTERELPEVQSGQMSQAASTMEQIADTYQLPSIHLGIEVARMEKEGTLLFKAPGAKVEQVSGKELDRTANIPVGEDGKIPFSPEGVHPFTDTGHRLYTEAIIRSIPLIQAVPAHLEPHSLRAPIDPDNLENAAMVPLENAKMSGPWQQLTGPGSPSGFNGPRASDFTRFMTSLWKAEPGAELTFRFKGTRAAIYDIVGPGCGKLEITVDGKSSQHNRIDPYGSYYRISSINAGFNLPRNEVHEVQIKLLSDPIDKESILKESNRADFKANPAKYAELNWYAGGIFFVGDWVP